ncbi:MAG: histidinol-phosphatase [Desulfobulbaceae bacterium]|nr:histidinol-phosphatase [Desulfobulbaceae bacterium]HIJ78758.1 histidinol-phosphatase [Deltaproteobacteria bacterium]
MIDFKSDGHVHTRLCHHARGEMEEYVLAAIARGLDELIFLEHLEKGVNYIESTWLSEDDFAYYHREGRRLKEKYQAKIKVGVGIEVGYNPRRQEEILDFLNRYPWDRIGISYHFYEIGGKHYNFVSRKEYNTLAFGAVGVDKVISHYLAGLLDAVNLLPGTVLCHLDAVLRYHPEVCFGREHELIINEIFRAMLSKGMALEINTSGIALRGQPFPAANFIRVAMAMGIPLVAGSDAHRPDDVGRYFSRIAEFC